MIATTDMNAPISLGENDKARPIAQTPTATKIEIIKTTSALCCLAQFFQLCGSALVTPPWWLFLLFFVHDQPPKSSAILESSPNERR